MTRFITVKVSVIGLGRTDVQPEGRVGQHLDAVALHRPLVQRRLPIEEDVVAVNHMPVHDVALVQIDHVGVDVPQRDHPLLLLDEDRLGTRVFRAVADVHHQAVAVVGRHDFGLREVCRNLFRNAELVDVNVGVGRDDGAGGEIDSLAHQVATDAAGLGAQSGLERLEWPTRPLCGRWHALDVVVDVGRHVEFEVERVLLDVVPRLALVDLLAELLVAANDINEFVREVVVHPLVVVHHDGRADGERRNGEDGADHPRGAAVLGVKAENADGLVGHPLEAAEHELGLDGHKVFVVARHLAVEAADRTLNLLNLAEHCGFAGRAGDGLLVALGGLVDGGDGILANGRETIHTEELGLEVAFFGGGVARNDVELGAAQTDRVESLDRKVEELVEVDGAGECDVPKVALALEIGVLAGRADAAALDDAEPCVKDSARNRVVALMRLVGDDLHDRATQNLLGGRDAELYSYDRHCILI